MTPETALVSQLPSHWTSARLGQLARIVNGGTPTPDEGNWEGKIPFITPPDIRRYSGQAIRDTERTLTLEGVQSGSTLVEDGVILSTRAPIGLVARVDRPSAFNQGCRVLTSGRLEPRYLTYALLASSAALEALGQGTTFMELGTGALRSFRVPVPSGRQQVEIANFLDGETAKIDALIEKQRLLISGMSERRSAILDHLVLTLPGAAERLRRFADVTVGIVVTPSAWYADDGVVALRGVNVRPESLSLDDVVYLSEEGDALHEKSRLRTGDVVVVRTGQAGAACAVPPSLFGANAIDLLIVRCRAGVMPEYLAAVLNSGLIAEAVKTGSVGAIQGHFNVSALKDVMVPIPDLPTQRAFLSEWRIRSAQLDALVCKVERAVVIAQEHRAALITEAVTGQLDLATGKVT